MKPHYTIFGIGPDRKTKASLSWNEAVKTHRTSVMVATAHLVMTLLLTMWVVLDFWTEVTFFLILMNVPLSVIHLITVVRFSDIDMEIIAIVGFVLNVLMSLFYWFGWIGSEILVYKWVFLVMGVGSAVLGLAALAHGIVGPIALAVAGYGSLIAILTNFDKWWVWMVWARWFILIGMIIGLIGILAKAKERTIAEKTGTQAATVVAQGQVPKIIFLQKRTNFIATSVLIAGIISATFGISGVFFPPSPFFPLVLIDIYDSMTIIMLAFIIAGGTIGGVFFGRGLASYH